MKPDVLKLADPEIFDVVRKETNRQHNNLELIASENFCSEAVLAALGSPLTNKYAEGYPKKRYYGGCRFVDIGENLARDRAKELFGCDHANVQPHSGTSANIAAVLTLARGAAEGERDTILGLNLSHGGHLSHGHPLNFVGRYFNVIQYQVDEKTEMLDYAEIRRHWEPVFNKHRVDMVFAGHVHYYMRSHPIREGRVVAPGEAGTVYVISIPIPNEQRPRPRPDYVAALLSGTPLYHTIHIAGNRLHFRAFDEAGTLHDELVMEK